MARGPTPPTPKSYPKPPKVPDTYPPKPVNPGSGSKKGGRKGGY